MKLSWPNWKLNSLFGKRGSRPAPASRPRRAPRPFNSVYRAKAARVTDADDDYEDDEQPPTTRLSTAFVVVVALHLVAVGGIYAFNSLKARHPSSSEKDKTDKTAARATPAPTKTTTPPRAPVNNLLPVAGTNVHKVREGETLARIALENKTTPGELAEFNGLKETDSLRSIKILNLPPPNPAAVADSKAKSEFLQKAEEAKKSTPAKTATAPRTVPKTYTVTKGDTVYSIVRKFSVNQDEFVKLNQIQNAKTLQAGRTVKLPQPK